MTGIKEMKGFTLIELMIVVAIIAIIAAIAIPSILRSRMSANEISARGSLDSVVKANQLIKENDTDSNGIKDYWAADIYGLWGLKTPAGKRGELIGADMASADYTITGDSDVITSGVSMWSTVPSNAVPIPKGGYYFTMLIGSDVNNPTSSDKTCDKDFVDIAAGEYRNTNSFVSVAFPANYDSSGRRAYLMTHGGSVYEIDASDEVDDDGNKFNKASGSVATSEGTRPLECEPSNSEFTNYWSARTR